MSVIPGYQLLSHYHFKLHQFLISDARHYQILFQTSFIIYGILVLGWEGNIYKYAAVYLTCILTQFILVSYYGGSLQSIKSAIISGMGICLMLRSGSIEIFMLASVLSIASKYIFRINGKHFFNPSNFGIAVTVLLANDAWLSPGQWGSDALLLFFIGAMGFGVVLTVKRLDTAIAFLLSFCGFHFLRQCIYQGWEADFFLHTLSSGTLLVFSFFMITDPVSTPSNKYARITWAVAAGLLAFWMQSYWFITGSPIWALFLLSPLTPVLDAFFKGDKFKWQS